MSKTGHSFRIFIMFDNPIDLEDTIEFKWPFAQCEPDTILVTDFGVNIHYDRLSGASKKKVFNATRTKYLQMVALGLSCLSSDRQPTPVYSSALYSIDGKADEVIEVPSCLLNIELGNSVKQLPFQVVKRSFFDDQLAICLRIMISYCWAAAQAISQEERLKLLWGSFNALYRYYYRTKNKKGNNETLMLDEVNKLFIREPIFVEAASVFSNEIEDSFKDFVRWKRLTGDKSRSICIAGAKGKQLDEKRDRLDMIDGNTLRFMRDFGCAGVPGKKRLKEEIEAAIDRAVVDNSSARRISLLLCRYIYMFRCNAVHAEVEYPVFDSKKENENRKMADLLEAAVIDFSIYLAQTGKA